MRNTKHKTRSVAGLTMMEMVIAMAIMAVVFAAILPQFANIHNSWDLQEAKAEMLQNGRVLTEHIKRNLSKAVIIKAVSDASDATGFIEFEANDGGTYRYEISADWYVAFGPVGNLSTLAGPVNRLQFTCYALEDLDTPITDVSSIRMVKLESTFANSASLGQDQSFTTQAFLYANAASQGILKGSSSSFGITTGNTPALVTVDAIHYLCAYTGPGNDGWAVVLNVDTASNTVSSEGSGFEYDGVTGIDPALSRIDARNYLCVYTGPGNDGWAVILKVNPMSWQVSRGTPIEIDATLGLTPSVKRIDPTHFLCAYTGPGNDGIAVVLTVNVGMGTIAMGAPLEFDAVQGQAPDLCKIDINHFLCAYGGANNDGWAVVLTVDTGAWTVAAETPFEYDPLNGLTPSMQRINGTHYLCVYSGAGDDGWAVVLVVDTADWSLRRKTPFEFDTDRGVTPILVRTEPDKYLCLYRGPFIFLWGTMLEIDRSTWSISKEYATMLTSVQAMQPDVEQVDSENYLCTHEDGTNNGWAVILNVNSLRP